MDSGLPSSPSALRRLPDLLAIVLLALFWCLAYTASQQWSHTSDELPHITAGYAYDKFGDFRMQPENGNLPQRLFGLPGLWLGAQFPCNEDYWRRSVYWQLGWDYLYGLGNPTDKIVQGARALNALLGVALGAFIYFVARRFHEPSGGLLSLAFYVFCPNFLGHSALATSDVAGALFLTLAPWCFWRHLEQRDAASGLIAGLCSGFALVAKFNGILLAPIYAAMAFADILLRGRPQQGRRAAVNLLLCSMQAVAAVAVIWMFFNFRFSAQGPGTPPLEQFAWSWPEMLAAIGRKACFIEWALDWRLLPQAWLYGLTNVLAGEAARPAFFAGEIRLHGWWQFFPTLFVVKTTVALLAALVIMAIRTGLGFHRQTAAARYAQLIRWTPLVVPAGIIVITAVTSHLNIGHRHILALYPALFVAAGGLVKFKGVWRLVLPVALLALQSVESYAIRPHYLAFLNPLGGGPDQAYRLVVDSSLDWGQDLPALRDWLQKKRHPGEPFYLAYFGSAWPPHYGVRPTHFLPAITIVRPPTWAGTLEPGLYCISATTLSEVYSPLRGPWHSEWSAELADPATSSDRRAELLTARLCKFLWNRPPDGNAGYSILIYRLGADELATILKRP